MRLSGRMFCYCMLTLLLTACAGERYHYEGMNMLKEGRLEEGLSNLEQAVKESPDNLQFRADLINRRAEQIARLLSAAETARTAGKWDDSEAMYKRVLNIEPGNGSATAGMDAVAHDRASAPVIAEATETFKKGDAARALNMLKPVLAENPANTEALALRRQIEEKNVNELVAEPTLRTTQTKPISLEFRDANLKIVFEALARTTGVNFILDKDVRPDLRTTIFLRQSSLEDAIALILETNRLEKKVLNKNTILIYPNTPEKLKEYQELVVKGFYLANADVKQTQAMIKALLKTKDIFIDEKLNLLVMRDTPEAIKLAEKLIAMHDLAEPEVVLDVEVLEISRSRLMELGVQWPNQLTLTPLGTSGSTTLTDLKHINSDRIGASLPSATLNLRRDVGDANILANPRVRVRNREKAEILIGNKVPVITTTTTGTGFSSENVQYLDVGIKLNVQPNIYLHDEVGIKVGLEVSSIVQEVRTPAGSLAYQIGTRSATTTLQLKDGETQVLAGLINDEDRMTASRIPGLGDIPLLGRLFGSQKNDRQKTEIVLSITPRLVRNIHRPEPGNDKFWSGTELALRTRPLSLQPIRVVDEAKTTASGNAGPKDAGELANASKAADDHHANAEASEAILSWQGPNQVKAGDKFKVALRLKTDGGLRSLPLQLGFDPAAFQVVEVSEGPFFKQNDAKTSLSSNVDPATGKVFASVVRSGVDGAQGEDNVIVLTLRALVAKPQAELKLLSAAPVSAGQKSLSATLPAPYVINITN